MLAVSVDPKGDTPSAVRAFVRSHHLRPQFHYLTGSASWYVLTWVTQVLGIRGQWGNLLLAPKLMPELVHMGPAAPCGLHGYESDQFGNDAAGVPYRDNLFACQFNLHKVSRHVLRPDRGMVYRRKAGLRRDARRLHVLGLWRMVLPVKRPRADLDGSSE